LSAAGSGIALLRRVLYLDALGCIVVGLPLVVAPRSLGVGLLGQPEYPDYAVVRLLGVCLLTLALFMVLVAQRIEELWWWSWALVILAFGGAAVATLHALLGVPPGAAAWPWWLLAAGSWGFCFGLLWGLARAGVERPPP
jgi:hypothetical protein